MQANIANRNVKKLQKTKKHVIKHTSLQTNLKDIKDIWYACKFSNIQTHKQSKVQTYKQKKIKSKLERNNEFQVIKYITNGKTKQPKTL